MTKAQPSALKGKAPNEWQRYALELEFDGSAFLGWQWQDPTKNTAEREPLQNHLERVVSQVLGRADTRFAVQGCGRTDAGVHAETFFAHVDIPTELAPTDMERFRHQLCCCSHPKLSIRNVKAVGVDFHALKSLVSKRYVYRILLRKPKIALYSEYFHQLHFDGAADPRIDLKLLEQAMTLCEGSHDFSAFASAGNELENTVRTLFECKLSSSPFLSAQSTSGTVLELSFHGNGFLKQMIRNLVGTLIEVATGKRDLKNFMRLLDPKTQHCTRQDAGPCAPPHGLYLVELNYTESPI